MDAPSLAMRFDGSTVRRTTTMHKFSILLGLNGSRQSLYAAELAWSLAEKSQGKVLAQHVIDSRTAWELLRNDDVGFIGSGPYIAAYDQLLQSFRSLANKLTEKYDALAGSHKVDSESVIDEGNPINRICSRAKEHDLVIVGHGPTGVRPIEQERCSYIRHAIAEGLAHECSKPLLIVQDKTMRFTGVELLMSADHINSAFARACIKSSAKLGLAAQIKILACGRREESPTDLKTDFRTANPDLSEIPISVDVVTRTEKESGKPWASDPGAQVDLDLSSDTLLVIPTRGLGHSRVTVFDTPPDIFVRHLALPAILLWPEEYTPTAEATLEEAQATA